MGVVWITYPLLGLEHVITTKFIPYAIIRVDGNIRTVGHETTVDCQDCLAYGGSETEVLPSDLWGSNIVL